MFATHADQGTRGPNGTGPVPGEFDYKRVLGGFLVQTRDALPEQSFTPKVVTQRHPVLAELTSLYFAWRAVKHVTSNGVVLAKGLSLVGFGSGQPNRQDAVDLACARLASAPRARSWRRTGFSRSRTRSSAPPTRGSRAIIQPGGSSRDPELIRAANRHGLAMIFTGERHYRH